MISYAVETAQEEELIETIGRGYYSYVAGVIASRRLSEERTREMEDMCIYCVRMLRSCDYFMGDLLCLFAVAASSLRNVFCHLNNPEPSEVLHIALAQVFLAHCWLFDEACPIKEWHTHIFRSYCSHSCLNGAVMKLFSIQGWRFSAPSALVRRNLLNLLPRKLTLKMIDNKPSQLHLKPN